MESNIKTMTRKSATKQTKVVAINQLPSRNDLAVKEKTYSQSRLNDLTTTLEIAGGW